IVGATLVVAPMRSGGRDLLRALSAHHVHPQHGDHKGPRTNIRAAAEPSLPLPASGPQARRGSSGPRPRKLTPMRVAVRHHEATATAKSASVLARMSSVVTPGASSTSVMPLGFFFSIVNTPRSVITMSTTPAPVNGNVHLCRSLGPSLAECS